MSESPQVIVETPAGGCWVASSCELRVRVRPPFGLASVLPTVRQGSGLEVLSITADDPWGDGRSPDLWVVRTMAFVPGDLSTPAMRVVIETPRGGRADIDVAGVPVSVQTRHLTAASPLADLELPPLRVAAWPDVVMALAATAAVAGVGWWLRTRAGRFVGRWQAWTAARRTRREATRLVRHSIVETDAARIYDRLTAAVRLVVGLRAGRSAAALTSPELVGLAASCRLDAQRQEALVLLLAASDAVRFGGHLPSAAQIAGDRQRASLVVASRFIRPAMRRVETA